MEFGGLASYALFFLTYAGIYAILALGLNVQWGLCGQLNIGIAGFFAVGAYASALLTTAPTPMHLGGFALPFAVGALGAMALAALLSLLVGLLTIRLRADYLAIATIGIAEIVRLVLKNEEWLTNGVRGVPGIALPTAPLAGAAPLAFVLIVFACVAVAYLLLERARWSPWGRVLRAIRENETAAAAAGKAVDRFRLQAFVLGGALMGLAGALFAHFVGFISPEAFTPEFATFLVWVMLIAGGSGNNRGAIAGAFVIWLVWMATEFFTQQLPPAYVAQAGALRVIAIGVLIQLILIFRPQGLLPEELVRRSARG
jgi:branched-chain amino acid transport system permease protein